MATPQSFEVRTSLLRAIGIACGIACLVSIALILLEGGRAGDKGGVAALFTFFACLFCLVSRAVAKRIEVSDEAIVIQPAGLRIARSEIESVRVMSRNGLMPDETLRVMKIETREHRWRWVPLRLYWFMGKISIDLYWMEDPHGFARALGVDLSDFVAGEPRRDA
ncbi:hypothetical protein PVT71_17280 [Salipiger sp. H15]|uniref:PH domain-containing protein n=1 Tax=Alloyangia sp. H15 TaxID=3029062 RepID=A0AAU8APX2_9RHOB